MKNRLREERNKHGLSAAQLGHVMNYSEISILAIEAGRYCPDTTLLLRLSKYFNIPPAELFVLEGEDLQFNEVPEEKPRSRTFLGFRLPW